MAQKAISDPGAFCCPFNKTRYIGNHEFAAPVADHAKLRTCGRKRISADFRIGVGDRIDEGRFSRIGQADKSGIG